MNLKKQTLQGVFWSGIQIWGSQAGSFIIFLVLARLLSPSAFGMVALANLLIYFGQILITQSFGMLLLQKKELQESDINTVFWAQVILGIIFTSASFVGAGPIAQIFRQPSLTAVIQALSPLLIITLLSETQVTLLRRNFEFKIIATRSLIGIFIGGIVGIVMALRGYGVWSLVAQQLTYEVVGLIVLWSASSWRPGWQFSKVFFLESLTQVIPIIGYRILEFFNQRSDNLLVGYFLGDVALGYYAIAHRILEVMNIALINTLNQVALPMFARLQNDLAKFTAAFYRANLLTSLLAFPIFFAVMALAPDLVRTLFGSKWSDSAPILQIISLAGVLRLPTLFRRSVFFSLGQPSLQLKFTAINSVLNIIACIIAVRWGMVAVASAYVLSDYLAFPAGQWFLNQVLRVPWKVYLSQFVPALTCSLMMSAAMMGVQNFLMVSGSIWFNLIFTSAIGLITYSLALILLYPKLFKEILELVNLLTGV